jgi:protein subunit release factor B
MKNYAGIGEWLAELLERGQGVNMKRWKEEEFEEVFSRARGPGGQHVNKVSTAVTLRHVPSGLRVTVGDSRSQAVNRAEARRRLMEKLRAADRKEKQDRLAEVARERRRKARRSRGTKAKMVEAKRRRWETKKLRSRVGT